MPTIDKTIRAVWHATWTPPKVQSVSEWADENRILTRETSAEPGPYRTARTPYAKEMMDTYGDSNIGTIVVPKSAQIGITCIADNMLGWACKNRPGPKMFTYPTQDDTAYTVDNRLRPMIEGSPSLSQLIPFQGFATHKQINLRGGTTIYMAWAASPRTLLSKPIGEIFFDELENCDSIAGSLGNNYALVSERTTTFGRRAKIVAYSTPSTTEGSLWQLWLVSDQRRYFVPCPLCGIYQVLSFDRIRVPDGVRDPQLIEIKNLAWYQCSGCEGKLDDRKHKGWMVERGVWIPRGQQIVERLPIADPEIVERSYFEHPKVWRPRIEGNRPLTRIAGFHIWSGYSPWRTWSKITATWFAWKDDPEKLRVFINSWLGEPFSQTSEEIREDFFGAKRAGQLPRGIVPKNAQVLISGADVQKDRIYYVVRGWGYRRENWLIEEGVCADLEELHATVTRAFPIDNDAKTKLSTSYLAIDSGYRTHEVYDFCKAHPGCYAMKGQQKSAMPVVPKQIDYTPAKMTKSMEGVLYHVDTSFFKEMLYRMAGTSEEGFGWMHLHRDASDEYVRQFTSEHQIWVTTKKKSGRVRERIWAPKREGMPNHFLDAEVYALALAYQFGALRLVEPEKVDATPPEEEKPWGKPRGWLK